MEMLPGFASAEFNSKNLVEPATRYIDSGATAPLVLDMPESRILVLCAEAGMGRTTILSRMVLSQLEQGVPSRYYDLFGMLPEESLSKLGEASRWSRRQDGPSAGLGCRAFVACDNVPVGDEADTEEQVRLIRGMVENGCAVALSILPEDEPLAEQLGEARCYWSCDLQVERPRIDAEASLYDSFVRGVPLLHFAIQKVNEASLGSVPMDPAYQECYISCVDSCVRPHMMEEEKRLRCAMLLLGSGSMEEAEEAVVRLDRIMWQQLSRDAPLFGVNVVERSFCCAGAMSRDCLNVAYATLDAMVRDWPMLVSRCARILASRGDYGRAAVVSLLCSDEGERCSIGLEWGIQFLDAGEINVVADALEAAGTCMLDTCDDYYKTQSAYSALVESNLDKAREALGSLAADSAYRRPAELALRSKEMLSGCWPDEDVCKCVEDDYICESLATHCMVLELMAKGSTEEAYELLLDCPLRLRQGVLAAILGIDLTLCSLLVGSAPDAEDVSAMRSNLQLLERSGITWLLSAYDSALLVGKVLAGQSTREVALETYVQRFTRAQCLALRGVLLVAAGVMDIRGGAYARAHVRLTQAFATLDSAHMAVAAKCARLLDLVVRTDLGERVLQSDVELCKGACSGINKVVGMAKAALAAVYSHKNAALGRTPGTLSRDAFWLANVLSNDCGIVSQSFRDVMPSSWDSLAQSARRNHERFFGPEPVEESQEKPVGRAAVARIMSDKSPRIEVCMMGGFDVYVDGVPMPASQLEKRRAKALLAVLVAVPGHVAKRYTLIESIWPSYDYQSAIKCVYSATSVLRSEVGAMLAEEGVPLVVSNKANGTLSLNMEVFCCDVDAFERKARRLLDIGSSESDVVSLCREIEDLYRGDLFVPPADGMGIVQARAKELKVLFADAMIAGSHAADCLGMKTLACRFARKACEADNMREDGIRTFVAALCSAGRHVEAERCYEQYVGRVVDFTRRPPSRHLRHAMEELLGESTGREGLDMPTRKKRDVRMQPLRLTANKQKGQLALRL